MRKALVILGCLSVMVASLAFLIHVRVQQISLGYMIAEREETVVKLEERLKQLRLEREVLMRPERVQRLAHEWFDMRYPHE